MIADNTVTALFVECQKEIFGREERRFLAIVVHSVLAVILCNGKLSTAPTGVAWQQAQQEDGCFNFMCRSKVEPASPMP